MLLCVNNLPHQPAYQKGRTSIALQQNPLAQHALPKNGKKKKKTAFTITASKINYIVLAHFETNRRNLPAPQQCSAQ